MGWCGSREAREKGEAVEGMQTEAGGFMEGEIDVRRCGDGGVDGRACSLHSIIILIITTVCRHCRQASHGPIFVSSTKYARAALSDGRTGIHYHE